MTVRKLCAVVVLVGCGFYSSISVNADVLGGVSQVQYVSGQNEDGTALHSPITSKVYSIDANSFGVFVATHGDAYISLSPSSGLFPSGLSEFYPVSIPYSGIMSLDHRLNESIVAVAKKDSNDNSYSLSIDLGISSFGEGYKEAIRRWPGDGGTTDQDCVSGWYYSRDEDLDICDQYRTPQVGSLLYQITPSELGHFDVEEIPTIAATYPFLIVDGKRMLAGLAKYSEINSQAYQKNNGYLYDLLNYKNADIPSYQYGQYITSNAGLAITPVNGNKSVDLIGAGTQHDAYFTIYDHETGQVGALQKINWDPSGLSVQDGAMVRWNRYVFIGTLNGLVVGIIPLTDNWFDLNSGWGWTRQPKCLVNGVIEQCPFFEKTVTSLGLVDDKLLVGTQNDGIFIFSILGYPENNDNSQPIFKLDEHIPIQDVQNHAVNAIAGYLDSDEQISVYYGNDIGLYTFQISNSIFSLLKSNARGVQILKSSRLSQDPFKNQRVDWE